MPSRSALAPLLIGIVALATSSTARLAAAAPHRRHHRVQAAVGSPPAQVAPSPERPAEPNRADFYRERGYGYGGTVFDLRSGGGGPALSGTCTSVADAPKACRQGGVYGNGLFYGFGLP